MMMASILVQIIMFFCESIFITADSSFAGLRLFSVNAKIKGTIFVNTELY